MNWLYVLLALLILLITITVINKINKRFIYEGFTQKDPFLTKMEEDVYDEFYAEIYDDIHNRDKLSKLDYNNLIMTTQPDENSYILDVGSGTGNLLNNLSENGYNSCGVEKSKAMVNKSKDNFPHIEVHNNDVNNSIIFDKGTFTHICCLDFTYYEIDNKLDFLRNCYYWLKPNGYLLLHLVDREKYNPIVGSVNPIENENFQEYLDKRLLKSKINFKDFTYNQNMTFKEDKVTFKETFSDILTESIRQNERTIEINDIDSILLMCNNVGFIKKGMYEYQNDKWQFIYILEKQL